MSDDGQSVLTADIGAFERVNGRPPTAEENREALALVEVVRAAKLDPFLVFYQANKRAQDALERVPVETQSGIDEAIIKISGLIERAATGGDPRLFQSLRSPRSRPLRPTDAAHPPELKCLPHNERGRRKVMLAQGTHRGIIVAYVLTTTTVAFTTWSISGYSVHALPMLIVVAAFVFGVGGTSMIYELR